MKKKSLQDELIVEIISRFPQGASAEEILVGLTPPPSLRTLQYRLASLIKKGILLAQGKTKGRKFFIVSQTGSPPALKPKEGIPLSPAAEALQARVNSPIQMRQIVSYNREFLDRYKPNQTYYLSLSFRNKLFELGKVYEDRPAGTYARQIFNHLLIDLSWNSSRLEGNTYSLLETERLIQSGEITEGKDQRETQMILNHKAAIEFLIESSSDLAINRYTILNLHALLSDNLLQDHACGVLRTISVGIGGSSYYPLAIPQLISECFQQIIDIAQAIQDPFEQAFFLMVHLPYLQPFEDVNKRVSRLAANIPLIQKNFCPLSFINVSEQAYINGLLAVYELNQTALLAEVFVWAYEQSCSRYLTTRQILGEPDPFRLRYRDMIRETVSQIVLTCMNKQQAAAFIQQRAKELFATADQKRFITIVETIVTSLHEGNVARYRISSKDYERWKRSWF